MVKMIRYTLILYMALLLIGCQTHSIKKPKIMDCMYLSSSVYCIDGRLDEVNFAKFLDDIKLNENILEADKTNLLRELNTNKAEILKSKSFELDIKYLPVFRGYYMISPSDRFMLQLFMNNQQEKLDKFKIKYGPLN